MLVCLLGFVLTMTKYLLFIHHHERTGEVMSERIAKVFLSDSLIYLITLGFGFFTFVGHNADEFLYPMRVAFISLNIYYGYRLVKKIE